MKTTSKDLFVYLGVFVGLYVSAINFLLLGFAVIENVFPITGQYYYDATSAMRWPIAILIIFFPVFIYLSKLLNKDLSAIPGKKDLGMRKFSIYFTLFVSGLTILIDLVTLIYRFLGAEDLSVRFFIKVALVLIVAGGIFKYYFYEIKRDNLNFAKIQKLFAWASSILVIALLAYSLILVGSPAKRHRINLDNQRVSDLMSIQNYVVYNQFQPKGNVPEKLANDPITGFVVPNDPETNIPYEYKKFSKDSFELCTNFSTDNSNMSPEAVRMTYPQYGVNENWSHPVGHYCFSRVVDESLFKSNVPVKN